MSGPGSSSNSSPANIPAAVTPAEHVVGTEDEPELAGVELGDVRERPRWAREVDSLLHETGRQYLDDLRRYRRRHPERDHVAPDVEVLVVDPHGEGDAAGNRLQALAESPHPVQPREHVGSDLLDGRGSVSARRHEHENAQVLPVRTLEVHGRGRGEAFEAMCVRGAHLRRQRPAGGAGLAVAFSGGLRNVRDCAGHERGDTADCERRRGPRPEGVGDGVGDRGRETRGDIVSAKSVLGLGSQRGGRARDRVEVMVEGRSFDGDEDRAQQRGPQRAAELLRGVEQSRGAASLPLGSG